MNKRIRLFAVALLVCALSLCGACAGEGAVGGDSSKSASAVDSLLSDGEYEVPVTLSGGSGKASVESPAKLVVSDGAMTATIVWSSSSYDQMVVDGVRYLPVNSTGNSTFEIPVSAFDEDISVQAETTAMSEPHMIDYTLHFSSEGLPEGSIATVSTQNTDFHNADMGNGWQVTSALDLDYAVHFTVDYFEGGYKLACLSDGARYLVVPQDASVPEGIDDDIVVLKQPVDRIYLVASDTMCLFDALGAIDAIAVSGIAKENWYIQAAVSAMEDGSIVYGGKYSAPDYDTLLANGCRLAIESTMINHTPDVRDKLIELGIPVLTELSSYEPEPLGRSEWVKLYGALLDKEHLASQLFDEQVAKADSVDRADTGKTVAFFYINSNGAAVVRKPGDYVTKMIELAGGNYIFSSLGDDSNTSTVTLEMERFYTEAKNADIIIYNATIDSTVDSLVGLVSKNELLGNFKAVQDGSVWVTEQNMYQQMLNTGDIIADFNAVFTGGDEELAYLRRLE